MQFGLLLTNERTLKLVQAKDLSESLTMVGLKSGEVDFGSFNRSVGYVVYEFSLFQPPEDTHYASIGKRLIAGNAVLYGVDLENGETIDFDLRALPNIPFFMNYKEVEEAIAKGEVIRPIMAVNDEVLWQWPDKKDDDVDDKLVKALSL